MIAYKGFTGDLTSVMGNGDRKTCTFAPGITLEVPESKTGRSGFHCCENPFDCFSYYSPETGSRYFIVEAEGDINEDGPGRIACTKITLLRELSLKEFTGHGVMYMVKHPLRKNWKKYGVVYRVGEDHAYARKGQVIAIARGPEPVAGGEAGSIVGLIKEPEPGRITGARLFTVTAGKAGRKYTIGNDGRIREVLE